MTVHLYLLQFNGDSIAWPQPFLSDYIIYRCVPGQTPCTHTKYGAWHIVNSQGMLCVWNNYRTRLQQVLSWSELMTHMHKHTEAQLPNRTNYMIWIWRRRDYCVLERCTSMANDNHVNPLGLPIQQTRSWIRSKLATTKMNSPTLFPWPINTCTMNFQLPSSM